MKHPVQLLPRNDEASTGNCSANKQTNKNQGVGLVLEEERTPRKAGVGVCWLSENVLVKFWKLKMTRSQGLLGEQQTMRQKRAQELHGSS